MPDPNDFIEDSALLDANARPRGRANLNRLDVRSSSVGISIVYLLPRYLVATIAIGKTAFSDTLRLLRVIILYT